MTSRPRRASRWVALAIGPVLTLVPVQVVSADESVSTMGSTTTSATSAGLYVVTLASRPAGTRPMTRPEQGRRYDRTRLVARMVQDRLLSKQDDLLAEVGDPPVLYRYTTAVNGFAAILDGQQVEQLRAMSRVALVERSVIRRTDSGPSASHGLDSDLGAWAQQGGPARAGRGTVIGVVDTGIWPDNPSFAGLPQQRTGRSPGLPGFHGACPAGAQWGPDDCNDKVVSAQWFVRGFGADRLASSEFLSPRDSTGHGSHAASTAAGEHDVRVTIDEQAFATGSGTAPAARLSVYKACWTAPDPEDDGCTTADTVAAIDQAVADGVDVISYSVSGSSDPADTVGRAFLGAAAAGVFVAASAGNDGPAPGSVVNASPWVTTVAASTHSVRHGAVVLGNGVSLVGGMAGDRPVPSGAVVRAVEAPAPGASVDDARLCEPGSLDASAVEDKVVVCERGRIPRTDKSAAVLMAGGRAMVLVNTGPDTVDADLHSVPTVHLGSQDGQALMRYLRDEGQAATVALGAEASDGAPVPAMASFSGRGPLVPGDLLKPDVAAPGVGSVGAVAPPSSSGRLWDLLSGTSVSTSYVAGLAALLATVHPTWSPSRIKSAMMTTADDLEGTAGPFAEGSGRVDPTSFADPGLVLDSRPSQWRRFADGELAGQDLNLPSVAVSELDGRTSVVRRLTNVARKTETYHAAVTGLSGIDVRVRPALITLRPGESRRVRVQLTATASAPVGEFARGRLTWTGLTHQVRIPVVVQAAGVVARVRAGPGSGRPVDVSSSGPVAAGSAPLHLSAEPLDAVN